MKKTLCAVLIAALLLLAVPPGSDAGYRRGYGHGHGRTHVYGSFWIGPRFWYGPPAWGPRYYWGGPVVVAPPYPAYGYYPAPPVIVQQPPPVFVQPENAEPENYWYYCEESQGYYPYVRSCPGGWMRVVPETTPPNP
jgi:hypothetical protein